LELSPSPSGRQHNEACFALELCRSPQGVCRNAIVAALPAAARPPLCRLLNEALVWGLCCAAGPHGRTPGGDGGEG